MEGQSDSHIDEVIEELDTRSRRRNDRWADEAIKVISPARALHRVDGGNEALIEA